MNIQIMVGGGATIAVSSGVLYSQISQFEDEAWDHWGGTTNWQPGVGGRGDAFKHAYVSARLAQYYGEDGAYAIGWIYEASGLFGEKPEPRDLAMDLWNDKVGAGIGAKYDLQDPNSPSAISDEIKQRMTADLITDYSRDHRAGSVGGYMSKLIPKYFDEAGKLTMLRDPLALDLNGDGIATISANEGIMFDHNGSGIKYGTGWINPSDGWLALDRNGNGTIDSGRELFGDSTRKLDGNFATNAYDALESFNTNNSGASANKIDLVDAPGDIDSDGWEKGEYWDINNNGEYDAAIDKTFADLRVWVDANSDGISSNNELKTLDELGITSIATGNTAVNSTDANGNLNTFKGNFTTTGDVVHADGVRAFNLVENQFFREFPDSINVPSDVAALPNMQGSGAVRDLHEAMSLGTAESLALKATVQAFNSATTREAQYGMIDELLMQWSRTSQFEDMVERLEGMTTSYRNFQTGQMAEYQYQFRLTTGNFWDESQETGVPDPYNQRNQTVNLIADPSDPDYVHTKDAKDHLYVNDADVLTGQTTVQAGKIQALAKTRVLEVFNNAQFFDFSSKVVIGGTDDPETLDIDERTQAVTVSAKNPTTTNNTNIVGSAPLNIVVMTEDDIPIPQSDYMHASYDQLRESVYQALALQTRLKPYMDAINITVDVDGNVSFDFAALDALVASKITADNVNGVLDLVDILKYRGADLEKSGWDAEAAFALVESTVANMGSSGQAALAAAGFSVQIGSAGIFNQTGESTANVLAQLPTGSSQVNFTGGLTSSFAIGSASENHLSGRQGNDVLFGNGGDDSFQGDDGAMGSGSDALWGGAGNDSLRGGAGDDYLSGGAGNDSIMADGQYETGNDWSVGGEGNDTLRDGPGSDIQQGGEGNDNYIFGDEGSFGDVDQILLERGDGTDSLKTTAIKTAGKIILLQMGKGIAPADVRAKNDNTDMILEVMDAATGTVVDASIKIEGFFNGTVGINTTKTIDGVVFQNGMVWSAVDIMELLFSGTSGNDTINGLDSADTINGGAGNDTIAGGLGNDVINGGTGSDTLSGNEGDDTIDGGEGDDTINGGTGNDTFIFSAGTGSDTVNSVDAGDVVKIGSSIAASELTIIRVNENEIQIEREGTADKITLNGDFRTILRDDGTVLADSQVWGEFKTKTQVLKQNSSDPRWVAMTASDYLGNHLHLQETGADNWQLTSVVPHFMSLFSKDTLDLDNDLDENEKAFWLLENFWGSGVNYLLFVPSTIGNNQPVNVSFDMVRQNDGLAFHVNETNAQLTLPASTSILVGTASHDLLDSSTRADNSTLTGEAGNDLLRSGIGDDELVGGTGDDILSAWDGDDILYGGSGDDVLDGGVGNDTLYGGTGKDIFIFDNNSGNDIVYGAEAGDTIKLTDNVTASDLLITRIDGNTIKVENKNNTDSLTIHSDIDGNLPGLILSRDGTAVLDSNGMADLKQHFFVLPTIDDRNVGAVAVAGDILGNHMDDPRKFRWQLSEATATSPLGSFSGPDSDDFDDDDNYIEDLFFFFESVWGSNVNALLFLPGPSANTTASFSYTLDYLDSGLTVKGNMEVITQSGPVMTGTSVGDILDAAQANNTSITLNAGAGDDVLRGSNANDELNGEEGNDVIGGDLGNDTLFGGAGDDVLGVGGWYEGGNDLMNGGPGSDNYHIDFLWAEDHDVIHNGTTGAAATDKDVLTLTGFTDFNQLWFVRDNSTETGGDDLIVTQVGSYGGTLRIEDWFSSDPEARLDSITIKEDDSDIYSFLLDSHFDSLVQAMSTVAVPTVPADINSSTYDDVRSAWANLAVDAN